MSLFLHHLLYITARSWTNFYIRAKGFALLLKETSFGYFRLPRVRLLLYLILTAGGKGQASTLLIPVSFLISLTLKKRTGLS